MKSLCVVSILSCLLFLTCGQGSNPFFSKWETPFGAPPFERIKEAHFLPAFKDAIRLHDEEIDAIVQNTEAPTFENTIEAMEKSGKLLTKVGNVFGLLTGAHTNDELQRIAREVSPLRSKHSDDIQLNEKLFQRIKTVYEKKDMLNLNPEQKTLLKKYYEDFVRGGANLNEEEKAVLREINKELSLLTLKFGENILKEDNGFELVIESEDDLVGLPAAIVAGAEEAARERGHEGKWIFTLHKPSWIPFLQYSPRRELREKIYTAYCSRGNNNNEYDNKEILSKIAALRVKKAHIMGYKTHSDFMLEINMAKEPKNVYKFLTQIWKPALKRARMEVKDMQAIIDREGGGFTLEPWDWWYYAEKVKQEKYALDEGMLRPYFKLENVRQGAFEVANKLYGITFSERTDIPRYHEDVTVYEVKEADGKHVGILYTDYFPRTSKRGGAWMNALRKQSRIEGKNVTPIIYNVGNFSKPTGDKPALLSWDEVITLFHEFGHALHGLLSNCTYDRLSGTSVPIDFVELPSQIMENWAAEPAVLKSYARHYETNEPIPDELINKIQKAGHFNQGFVTVEYLAASFLDMDWHTLTTTEEMDALAFESKSMKKIGLIEEIIPRYRSYYFRHIFSGGYSSGYYSYIWAEVLDKDAFQAFKETSLFDQATAQSFRKNIISAGSTDDPMVLYKRFRGAEPKIDALLEGRGLK